MSSAKLTRQVVVVNPQGLHARPADLLVKTALQYPCRLEVVKEGLRVDGKSILSVLTLVATEGTQLTLEAEGEHAEAALEALSALFAEGFGELEHGS